MNKFFAKKIIDNNVYFFENDINHIQKVLRLKKDDTILITYDSKKYEAIIKSINPLRAIVIKEIDYKIKKNYLINVYCSSIKPNHIEDAINKCCQLNVDNFYIFKSEYSQNNIFHNIERYKKIIIAASKQSNRNNLMNIEIINCDEELISNLNSNDINIIADFKEQTFNEDDFKKNKYKLIGLIFGPEGGFNNNDFNKLDNVKNKYIINLTNTILRTETSIIYLVSIIDYLMKS